MINSKPIIKLASTCVINRNTKKYMQRHTTSNNLSANDILVVFKINIIIANFLRSQE